MSSGFWPHLRWIRSSAKWPDEPSMVTAILLFLRRLRRFNLRFNDQALNSFVIAGRDHDDVRAAERRR